MERLKVNVCGLSEVRWAGQGHFTTLEGHTIVYAGESNQGQRGVAVWLHKNITGAIIGYEPVSSRIIKIRLTAKPRNITMVQAYGPTSVSAEADIGEFYEDLSKAVRSVSKKDILVVTGDFNAKLGMEESAATGRFGLGHSNDVGDRLREFFIEHELIVANTIFQHHPRRRYTWISPDGQTRNQIDYIAIKASWRTSLMNCKTYPGADCDTDHVPVVVTVKAKFKKRMDGKMIPRLNVEALKEYKAELYAVEVTNRFDALTKTQSEQTPEELWNETKTVLLETAEETIGFKQRQKRKMWISDETFAIVKEKREAKTKCPEKYRELKTVV